MGVSPSTTNWLKKYGLSVKSLVSMWMSCVNLWNCPSGTVHNSWSFWNHGSMNLSMLCGKQSTLKFWLDPSWMMPNPIDKNGATIEFDLVVFCSIFVQHVLRIFNCGYGSWFVCPWCGWQMVAQHSPQTRFIVRKDVKTKKHFGKS